MSITSEHSDKDLLEHYAYLGTRLKNAKHPRVIFRLTRARTRMQAEIQRRKLEVTNELA